MRRFLSYIGYGPGRKNKALVNYNRAYRNVMVRARSIVQNYPPGGPIPYNIEKQFNDSRKRLLDAHILLSREFRQSHPSSITQSWNMPNTIGNYSRNKRNRAAKTIQRYGRAAVIKQRAAKIGLLARTPLSRNLKLKILS